MENDFDLNKPLAEQDVAVNDKEKNVCESCSG